MNLPCQITVSFSSIIFKKRFKIIMDLDDVYIPVEEFNAALWKRFQSGKIRNVYPLAKYNDIIEKIKTMQENPPCNTPGEYYLLRKFIVLNINGKERLSCKAENEAEKDRNICAKFYVALEEIYSYLNEAHKWVKHGCRDRMVRRIQAQGIVNITRDTIELFLSFCKLCRPGKNFSIKKFTNKSILSTNSLSENVHDSASNELIQNAKHVSVIPTPTTDALKLDINQNGPVQSICAFTRGFVDLIDYSLTPDGDYRHVFLYMDVQTCLCALFPVRCKCSSEIVSHLLNVFTLLGPPQVLHSNFDGQFLSAVIREVKLALPNLVLVSGSANYSEVQEVARNCKSEVNSMLRTWMVESMSNNWSYGLKLVQFNKNTKIPSNSDKSSYESFFGRSVDSSLLSTMSASELNNLDDEEQLLSFINEQSSEQPYERLQVSLDPDVCSLVQNNNHENTQVIEKEGDIRPVIKSEPLSESDNSSLNGYSDSSNDGCASPNTRNLEVAVKQEPDKDS